MLGSNGKPAVHHRRGDEIRRVQAGSSTTGFAKVPTPSTSTSHTSPAFIHTGGLRANPTPEGVPP
jgi:hypothetical protein